MSCFEIKKNLLDNKSALLLLMPYMDKDISGTYNFKNALKNGDVVRFLKFLWNFNRFKNDETK